MPALSLTSCAARRERLSEALAHAAFDIAVITDVRDCYYFSGTILPNDLPAVLIAAADGFTSMVCPDGYEVSGVDRVVWYNWNQRGTRNPNQLEGIATALDGIWPSLHDKRVGVQVESISLRLYQALERAGAREVVGIDEPIATMQRRKDPDELEVIQESIRANIAAVLRAAIAGLLLTILASAANVAAQPVAAEPPPERVDALLKLLADPEVRAWLERRASEQPVAVDAAVSNQSLQDMFNDRLAVLRAEMWTLIDAAPALPTALSDAWSQLTGEMNDFGLLRALLYLLGGHVIHHMDSLKIVYHMQTSR